MLRWKRKSYQRALAPRMWRYVIDAAAKLYAQEVAPEVPANRWDRVISPATRDIVAVWMTDEFERLADAGQFDGLVVRRAASPPAAAARTVAMPQTLAALFVTPLALPAPAAPAAPAPPVQPALRARKQKPVRPVQPALSVVQAPALLELQSAASQVIRRRKPATVVQAVFEGPLQPPEEQRAVQLAEAISASVPAAQFGPVPEIIAAARRRA
jgi:hypothetical protein